MKRSLNLTERILKGSATVLFLSFLISPLGYLIRSLYSHTLSIETFGLFFAVLSFFNMVSTYNDWGFGATVSFLLPKYLKKKDYSSAWKVYRYGQIIQISTAVIISLLIIPFATYLSNNYFKVPGSENLIYIMCIYLIGSSFLNSILQVYIGLQKEKYYASVNLIRLLLTLSFSAFFAFFNTPNILLYAVSWAIGYSFAAVIYTYLLHRNHSYITSNKISWDQSLFKSMYSYAIPTLILTSISSFINFSDNFFLTLIKGVREVGIYNIILPIASIPNIFLSPVFNFLFPLISHLAEGEKEKIQYLIEKLLKIIPFLGLYFGLFIIMYPSIIVRLIFGQKWVGLVEIPLIILTLGYVAIIVYSLLGLIIGGLGEVKKKVKITFIIALSNIITTCLFVWLYGVIGAVTANTLVGLLSIYLCGRIVKTIIPFQYPYVFYLKLLMFSIFLYLLVKILNLNPTGWISFFIAGFIYTLIFATFGYIMGIYDKSILKFLPGKK